jgi:hypothetical protein
MMCVFSLEGNKYFTEGSVLEIRKRINYKNVEIKNCPVKSGTKLLVKNSVNNVNTFLV